MAGKGKNYTGAGCGTFSKSHPPVTHVTKRPGVSMSRSALQEPSENNSFSGPA